MNINYERKNVGCYNWGEFIHVQRNCRFDHKLLCDNCQRPCYKNRYSTQDDGGKEQADLNDGENFLTIKPLNAQSLLGNMDEITLLINER